MRRAVILIFGAVLAVMLYVTVTASLAEGVFAAGGRLMGEPWFRATLADAYCGFIAVYVWIAWRERSVGPRVVWFVLLMTLGNIAIAAYFLLTLVREGTGSGIDILFQRRAA